LNTDEIIKGLKTDRPGKYTLTNTLYSLDPSECTLSSDYTITFKYNIYGNIQSGTTALSGNMRTLLLIHR
jgi:hypothetical protein